MNLSNIHGLPDALVRAIRNDPYQTGGDISNTRLIDSPQIRLLQKRYRELIVEDISEKLFALLGQALHTILERANGADRVEERLFAQCNGWNISGQFDRMDLNEGVLDDYKVCSVYKAEGGIEWERQLNVLRWLAFENGHQIHTLRVIAFFRDWSAAKAERDPLYPQVAIKIIKIPVWPLEQTKAYVSDRVDLHRTAEQTGVMECSPEERWYSGTKWALMKEGGKRATKLFDAFEDVPKDLPPGFKIEERPGEYKRCKQYCSARAFCPQWKLTQQTTMQQDQPVEA